MLTVHPLHRSYRYGQQRAVFVYRLVAQGSMEDKVFRRQLNKRALASGVGDDDHQARQFSASETADLLDATKLAVNQSAAPCASGAPDAAAPSTDGFAAGSDDAAFATDAAVAAVADAVLADGGGAKAMEDNNGDGGNSDGGGDDGEKAEADDGKDSEGGEGGEGAGGGLSSSDERDPVLLALRDVSSWVGGVIKFDSLVEPDALELTEDELRAAQDEFDAEIEADHNPTANRPPASQPQPQPQPVVTAPDGTTPLTQPALSVPTAAAGAAPWTAMPPMLPSGAHPTVGWMNRGFAGIPVVPSVPAVPIAGRAAVPGLMGTPLLTMTAAKTPELAAPAASTAVPAAAGGTPQLTMPPDREKGNEGSAEGSQGGVVGTTVL